MLRHIPIKNMHGRQRNKILKNKSLCKKYYDLDAMRCDAMHAKGNAKLFFIMLLV